MDLIVEHVNVWAASIQDEPGGLATVLNGLKEAGADLDFVISRRAPEKLGIVTHVTEKPDTGVVFVAPLRGDSEIAAASDLGFNVTSSIKAVRVEGENKPGIAAELMDKLAIGDLNLRGFSAAVIGARFIFYIGFDTTEDAAKALTILKSA
jgi:hypothetical protein